MVNIFDIPVKDTINASMKSKSFMVVGKSKSGKSTLGSQAPRPIFLMTENGGEGLTGFTPVPIGSWADFKQAVIQLCMPQAREKFDTVVIDTYTNLILLLDKYVGQKLSTDKSTLDFGSDADYGKGTKAMRNELGIQLQKLANQGYILLNIVHAEDKTDFQTQKQYIGTSLSPGLYGVAEKFVDQIIYLKRERNKDGTFSHKIYFNPKGGFEGTGGRWTPDVDSVDCSYDNLEKVMVAAIEKSAEKQGAKAVEATGPSVTIQTEDERILDFPTLKTEFDQLTKDLMAKYPEDGADRVRAVIETVLGPGKKVGALQPHQAELLAEVNTSLKANLE